MIDLGDLFMSDIVLISCGTIALSNFFLTIEKTRSLRATVP